MAQTDLHERPDRSYKDYLLDVGGELDASRSMNSEIDLQSSTNGTPHSANSELFSTQRTEARSFVNGLLSPFSPLLKDEEQRDDCLQFVSLQPCRKVSVVVRVLPCDDGDQRCVFPHVPSESQGVIRKPRSPRDMVVVNPTAFGKFIPSEVTMETAKLVAQVANISSEDWARLYEFHHVIWPTGHADTATQEQDNNNGTMDSLGRAIAQDALVDQNSALIISTGETSSCIGGKNALLPKIIACCQEIMEQKAACSFSLLEVPEDRDTLRDLLDTDNQHVNVRHVDMKGAVVEGLTEAPLENISEIYDSLLVAKKTDSAIIATIKIWENAVSQQVRRDPTSCITLVEMSPLSRKEERKSDTVKETSFRSGRSSVSLGIALRQLLLHDVLESDPAVSYRDSTLTKVLQRSLESSKIVLLASVSQLSRDYESTLITLNYLRRLLVKLGKTASSPFKNESFDHQTDDSNHNNNTAFSHLANYVDDQHLLEKLVADPRQRLAKVLKPSPSKTEQDHLVIENAFSQDEYTPTDYMDFEFQHGTTYYADEDQAPSLPAQNRTEPQGAHPIEEEVLFYEEKDPSLNQSTDDSDLGSYMNQSYRMQEVQAPQAISGSIQASELHLEVVEQDDSSRRSPETRSIATSTFSGMSSVGMVHNNQQTSENLTQATMESREHADSLDPNSPLRRSIDSSNSGAMPDAAVPYTGAKYDAYGDNMRSIASHGDNGSRRNLAEYLVEETPDAKLRSSATSAEPFLEGLDGIYSSSPRLESYSGQKPMQPQDETSEKHGGSMGEIQMLEGAVNQIQSMQSGLWESSTKSLHRLKQSLVFEGQEATRLLEERDALSNQVNALQQDLNTIESEYEGIIEGYEEEVSNLQQTLGSLQSANQNSVSEIASIKKENADLSRTTTALRSELKEAIEKAEIHEQKYLATLALMDDLKVQKNKLVDQVGQLEDSKVNDGGIIGELEQEKLELQGQVRSLHHGQSNAQLRINDLARQNDNLQEQYAEAHNKIKQLETECMQKDNESNGLRSTLRRMENAATDAKSRQESLEAHMANDEEKMHALEEEVRRTKSKYSAVETELNEARNNLHVLQVNFEVQAREMDQQAVTLEKQRHENISLRENLNKATSALRTLKESISDTNASVQQYQAEKAAWLEERAIQQIEHANLQKKLTEADTWKSDYETLLATMSLKEKENSEMKSKILQLESILKVTKERHEVAVNEGSEAARHLKEQLDATRGIENAKIASLRNEIVRLENNLESRDSEIAQATEQRNALKSQLFAAELKEENLIEELKRLEGTLHGERQQRTLSKERTDGEQKALRSQLFDAEKREEMLRLQLEETGRNLGQERLERSQLEGQLSSLRGKEDLMLTKDEEMRRQNTMLLTLQQEHTETLKTLRETLTKLQSSDAGKEELTSRISEILEELAIAKENSNDVKMEHKRSLSDNRELRDELSRLSAEMDRFTRHSTSRQNSLSQELQKMNEEGAILRERNLRLEGIVAQTEMERNKAYEAIVMARQRVSRLTKSKSDENAHPLSTLELNDAGRHHLDRELYVSYAPHVDGTDFRSEEIASCIAVSARLSLLQSQKETAHMRSHVYKLEEEKEAEVAALKKRIKTLESRSSRSPAAFQLDDGITNWDHLTRDPI